VPNRRCESPQTSGRYIHNLMTNTKVMSDLD
jgi:hypothetical protein